MTSSIDRRRFAVTMCALRVSMLVAICGSSGPGQAAVFGCAAGDTDINFGDNVTCQIEIRGDSDRFRFRAEAGDLVHVRATRQGGGGRPCIAVFASNGDSLSSECTSFNAESTDLTIVTTGDYLIRISERDNDETLDYAVSLERLFPITPNAVPLSFGANLPSKLDTPIGTIDYYRFRAEAGNLVHVRATRQGGGGRPCITVNGPNGDKLSSECTSFNAESTDLTIVTTGDYLIRISERDNDETLDYAVSLERLFPITPNAVPLSFGANLPSKLDTPIGTIDYYRFRAEAGNLVHVRATRQGGGGRPCITVNGPNGDKLSSECTSFNAESTDLTIVTAGDYLIRISERDDDETLDYAVSLERLFPITPNAVPLSFGANLPSKLDTPIGTIDYYRFRAEAGNLVHVRATRQGGGGRPCITVNGPNGDKLSSECTSFNAESTDLTIVTAGDYLIRISERDDDETLDYVISAECFGICPAVGPGPGQQQPLVASPASLSFSFVQLSEAAIRRLFVSNTTSDSLPFQVAASTQSGGPWLSVTPENGDVTPDAAVAFTVRADPGGLPAGAYLGEIRVSSSAVPQVTVVPVTMAISRRQQLLRLSQTGATFIAVSGAGPISPQSFRVLNDGLGLLNWTIIPTTLSGGPWLAAEPAAGMTNAASSSAVEMRVDPTGLEAGVYYGIVEVAAPEAASSPQFVTVVLALLAPGTETLPAVFPTGLVFATLENGPAPDSQSVQITNLTSSALSFTSSRSTEDGNDWFVHTPTGAAVPPAGMVSIDVQADPTGLAAGIYRGTLSLSFDDDSTATVDLVFVVAATETTNLKQAGRLQSACQRSELAPVFQVLGTTSAIPAAWPARIEVGVVDNCGNPMQEGLVEVEFSNIASPNLALGRLEPGVWSGTWDVPNTDQQIDGSVTATATDAEGLTGSFTASVALAPNAAPAPKVNTGGVVHAASFVAEPLAPGTIISIFGSALSREPTNTPGELAPSLPLPTDLAGTEITIGGVPVPLIFSREDQLNAVIPFELLDRENETLPVLVHRIGARSVSLSEPVLVTAARPGVFTLNASGRGAAVIQDVNFQTVTAFNPVAPGDVIQIFCTGLGPVEPEVPTGAAAPLSPLSWVVEDVEVTIGGIPAKVSFAGLTPGFAGLYQINAFVPVSTLLGQPELVVSIAGQKSLVVTVSVR